MRRLKQTLLALTICTLVISCSLTTSSTIMKVQRGMSQEEVSHLLGKPDFRRFDNGSEQWEYTKTNMSTAANTVIIIDFVDGMVTNMDSFESNITPPPVAVCPPNEIITVVPPSHPDHSGPHRPKHPYMDVDRVGIYGCSAGGQESTNAVLLYPDFYKAAYSACGCHDNRMDKIWWNELWLGYPVGDQYKEGSNVENAHLLSRPLMLVVGELDDNVDPASTMQVVNALIKANKDFELVVIPGAHHTMGEDFGEHKRYDFFVRHLMQVNPPKWDEIK